MVKGNSLPLTFPGVGKGKEWPGSDRHADYVFTDNMSLWDLDLGFTHPFTLGGTISSGIFKRYSHPSAFDPDSYDLPFAFHESVLLSSRALFPSQ